MNVTFNGRVIKRVSVELDEIRGGRVREYERHDKSGRGSSYRRGPAVFAEIAAAAVHHPARHDRYVQFRTLVKANTIVT